jgi:ABC-type Na+ efflux pump permease subunit
MKKKIFIIIQREYFEKIRRPIFWVMSFFTPLVFLLGLIFTIYLSTQNSPTYRVLIYAENEPTLAFIQALQLQDNEKLKIKFFYTCSLDLEALNI